MMFWDMMPSCLVDRYHVSEEPAASLKMEPTGSSETGPITKLRASYQGKKVKLSLYRAMEAHRVVKR
jgi:hypothetical protein